MNEYFYKKIISPLGYLYLITDDTHLRAVIYETKRNYFERLISIASPRDNSLINLTELQLSQYFSGERKKFDLPLFYEGTPFQMNAWNSLLQIPYGTTISYAQQAENIENSKAVRAIGHANSLNPISIIIPCHRVIGKSGKLVGYGGGLDSKKYLISLEKGHIL
ncbi:MAG: methylated-DNA--[protein]-cysteine S-methyltransferase [SAR202 cluster bacterium]|nr:hypothetical protein [Chloroflexota bacterium]MQG50707.1 methylated-DNA--[protein]-cysteine S-methyltransferase [SAR202 cluster bacterium]|tara:strand:- start:4059 stop:4550 length:492 start_codon:yes stop_codon:yes gene_type:complete